MIINDQVYLKSYIPYSFDLMALFYATCAPGLEFISADEIEKKRMGKIVEKREGRGRVFFESSFEEIPLMHCSLRTIERIVYLLARQKVKTLDEIYEVVRKLDLSMIRPDWSFAIRPTRTGKHDFTSIDIARVSGQAVIDNYMSERNVRLKVNLDEPDVIIRCDLIGDELTVGIDMTGDDGLHKRRYRIYQHPAPLNPAIAASLVYLSGWSSDFSLLDPFCGSGTILFEAGMIARNTPICKYRKDFAFMKFFDNLPEVEESNVPLKLYGIEKFRKHVEGARKIADYVGIRPIFIQGTAEKIDSYINEVDYIVTNPPYGMRVGRKNIIERIYSGFLTSASLVLRKRMVVITSETEIFERYAVEHFSSIRKYSVRYGDLMTAVYVIDVA